MTQHKREELLTRHLAHLIICDDLTCRDALADSRGQATLRLPCEGGTFCFHEEQLRIDAKPLASFSNALHVEVKQHPTKVENYIRNHENIYDLTIYYLRFIYYLVI